MPSWLLPAVKLILPHVGDIVAAAKPVFTKRKGVPPDVEGNVVPNQIAELQAAASENAAHIKDLAEQLRLTVAALEQGAAEAEKRIRRAYALALVATLTGMAGLAVAVLALVG
ncbi:MAG: hypothetical protein ACXW2I_15060 [Burkholderiales bacterium]